MRRAAEYHNVMSEIEREKEMKYEKIECRTCGNFVSENLMNRHLRSNHKMFISGKPEYTVWDLRKEVKKLDPKLDESDSAFGSALILLSSMYIEEISAENIAEFCKLPLEFVESRFETCVEQGIFVGNQVAGSEWFEENGAISFWADVLVAEGMLQRA